MSYLDHIKICNNFTTDDKIPFVLDSKQVGWVREDFVDYLIDSKIFIKNDSFITIDPKYKTFEQRTKALDIFARMAYKDKITNIYMKEPYPVIEDLRNTPLCLADRSISTLLGLISFGQHLNGYVKTKEGVKMWIARRSYTKGYEAGKLDHIVAGGLPYGISLRENLQKECYEEAGMDEEISKNAISTGFVSYKHEFTLGGKKDIIYCYDLQLSPSFVPKCNDAEVEEFYLMDIEEVANIVKTSREFKQNCNLVIIDFLVRHGYIRDEDEDYLEIVRGLRV